MPVPTATEQVSPALAKGQQQSGQRSEPGGVTSRGRNDPFLHCLLSPTDSFSPGGGLDTGHRPAMRAEAGGAGKGGGGVQGSGNGREWVVGGGGGV